MGDDMKMPYRNMRTRYRKWLCVAMCAITSTRLTEVTEPITIIRNNHISNLVFSVSFFDKIIKTFSVEKELHFKQNSFKTHWDYWKKLIETRKNVGAIWLLPKGEI